LRNFGKYVRKIQNWLKKEKITGTIHEHVCIFIITFSEFF
jgi:hypothetical protein